MSVNARTLVGTVHLIDPTRRHGVRCNNAGNCNASADLASVNCGACLNLHRHNSVRGIDVAIEAPDGSIHGRGPLVASADAWKSGLRAERT